MSGKQQHQMHVGMLVPVDIVFGNGRAQLRDREFVRRLLAQRKTSYTDFGCARGVARHDGVLRMAQNAMRSMAGVRSSDAAGVCLNSCKKTDALRLSGDIP
ncbi:hypothetical protein [Luteimonas cucumeris]|uniref:hypothetical protein n=1 Tax=Luteimonas cucumeris TaxID=985012 RepID=UPI0013153B36|nr:hypothetical protein [Luteimonas cucumeris]